MRSETRINLYVVVGLLIFMAPGGFILFRSKLNPLARRLGQPDPVDQSRPYMDPVITPDSVPRTAPALTRGWVRSQLTDYLHAETIDLVLPTALGDVPVVSDGRRVQLAYLSPTDSTGTRAIFVFWSDAVPPASNACRFSADFAGRVVSGVVRQARTTDLPRHVRGELQEAQFISPPLSVQWFDVDFPVNFTDSKAPVSIVITYDNRRGGEQTETIKLP